MTRELETARIEEAGLLSRLDRVRFSILEVVHLTVEERTQAADIYGCIVCGVRSVSLDAAHVRVDSYDDVLHIIAMFVGEDGRVTLGSMGSGIAIDTCSKDGPRLWACTCFLHAQALWRLLEMTGTNDDFITTDIARGVRQPRSDLPTSAPDLRRFGPNWFDDLCLACLSVFTSTRSGSNLTSVEHDHGSNAMGLPCSAPDIMSSPLRAGR